jgi:hypothetical protein
MNCSEGHDPLTTHLTKSPVFDSSAEKTASISRFLGIGSTAIGFSDLTGNERAYLLCLQRLALSYFVDNQMPNGLMLDRQRNLGNRLSYGLCSTATTGMGFIALALAASPPYNLIPPSEAIQRVLQGLSTAREQLPHDEGIMPHFVDSLTDKVKGHDALSTIDSTWLITGALTAAIILKNSELEDHAAALYRRVNWQYWTAPEEPDYRELLRHGMNSQGRFLLCSWDRLNGETLFMYVLGAGAEKDRSLSPGSLKRLEPFYGNLAGTRFCSADLGLFVFQYGLDLLDLRRWKMPGDIDLATEAEVATTANYRCCREMAGHFATFTHHWGLSAGDGPGKHPDEDSYRCYAPSGPVDGTAHLTATLASIAHLPEQVMENLARADSDQPFPARGRYGFSNVNHTAGWVGRDMVGIDAGAAALALDNFLMENRVRNAFHRIPFVQSGIDRLGFRRLQSIHDDSHHFQSRYAS